MKGNLIIFFILTALCGYGQSTVSDIKEDVTREEIEAHIRFLASDQLLGREAGSPEIDIAAAYIAAYFEANGVKKLPAMDSYFQSVPLYQISTPEGGTIDIGTMTFTVGEELATDYTRAINIDAPVVYINYGSEGDYSRSTVKDKVVILLAGDKGVNYQQALSSDLLVQKMVNLKEAGAKAAIILWHYEALPWGRLQNYLQRETLSSEKPDKEEGMLPYFYVNATNEKNLDNLKKATKTDASIRYKGRSIKELESYNVIGYIEGTDAAAKEEYLLLSAHYDHIGGEVSADGEDLIFNGARDNAVGTAAIIMAGEYFVDHRPKRSVILAAWTAEEKGLIGSRYFSENPPIPLEKVVFNLNIDNAGYNDTTKVTVIGLNRTKAKDAIIEASTAFGLEAITDPAPEQNLFDRSDNVNFARKGIPSPTFSLGFTAFDQEIGKYYHNVADEAESLNFNYITKYTRSFIYAAQKIADPETETFWISGDKYEEMGKKLYNK
jgi:hypothetical protein